MALRYWRVSARLRKYLIYRICLEQIGSITALVCQSFSFCNAKNSFAYCDCRSMHISQLHQSRLGRLDGRDLSECDIKVFDVIVAQHQGAQVGKMFTSITPLRALFRINKPLLVSTHLFPDKTKNSFVLVVDDCLICDQWLPQWSQLIPNNRREED